MNTSLFGDLIQETPKQLSKKERRAIERAKLLKLGQANYFYPTTSSNVFHTDGFVNGINGQASSGGFTVFKNGKLLITTSRENKNGFTNNEAELLGIQYALSCAECGDEIVTDSMIALSWVRNGNPKARPDLKTYASECKNLLNTKKINLYWASRDDNQAGNYNEFDK